MAIQQSTLRELALFAGGGGGILGGHLLGWRTICAVERDAYAAQVLAQRQNDGSIPPFPIWSDVETFDGTAWRGRVDIISGGFPCQDISVAGKGAGMSGSRSGLWSEFNRIIGEVRPRFVFVENSPALTSRGLGDLLGDLAALGYDAEWGVLGASDVGAHHERKRIWIVAHSASVRLEKGRQSWRQSEEEPIFAECSNKMADCNGLRELQPQRGIKDSGRWSGDSSKAVPYPDSDKHESQSHEGFGQRKCSGAEIVRSSWPAEPGMGRVANGVAHRVDKIRALGNGQVPRVAATAFEELIKRAGQ